MIPLKFLDPIT